jgi:hypothetical protein
MITGPVFLLVLVWASSASAQDWSIDWYSIDGGGVIESETADQEWQLAGTIAQWDAQSNPQLTGSGFQLTAGFWSLIFNPLDALFRDRFEVSTPPPTSVSVDHEKAR